MIARVWHGWTTPAGADAYQHHFQSAVLAQLELVDGFRGAELWRREQDGDVELVAVSRFESLDAVRAFAGADYEVAVVAGAARDVLTRFDARCAHYEVPVSQVIEMG
jgi:heme-degrading monooxygenase HmoA